MCLLLRVVYRPREEEKKWRSEPNKKKKNNEYILNLSLPSQTDETNENQKILLVLNLNFSFSNEYVLFYFFVEVCELLCDFFCSGFGLFGFLIEKNSQLYNTASDTVPRRFRQRYKKLQKSLIQTTEPTKHSTQFHFIDTDLNLL